MDPSVCQAPAGTRLSSLAFLVAADYWIKEKPENAYSKILRRELLFLVNNGRFSFDEEVETRKGS